MNDHQLAEKLATAAGRLLLDVRDELANATAENGKPRRGCPPRKCGSSTRSTGPELADAVTQVTASQ
jgi:hypothetical protein